MASAADLNPESPVLGRLVQVAERRGLSGLAGALTDLSEFVSHDLSAIERELAHTPTRADLVGKAADHLLDLKGKRIRPLCVALSARAGRGFSAHAVKLAAAVELVHSATLLHDDVIDEGELRRGRPTSRVLFGNAASVFAGDWLLIHALRLVQAAGVEGLLDRLLQIIDEMIEAESVQLERRGKLSADRDAYFRIIEGKTASLFRWAMVAGGRAGGLSWSQCDALAAFGNDLGMAFQIVDDTLDLSSDTEATGKNMFADVKEGKITYPLLVAMEREPRLLGLLEQVMDAEGEVHPETGQCIQRVLNETRALGAALEYAHELALRARGHLGTLPESEAKTGLDLVAEAAVRRSN
ncbi:MAG: polyprenyl synthetase family protein [Myxococcota bacterium]